MEQKKVSARRTRVSSQPIDQAQIDALKMLRIVIRAAQRHSAWVEKQCGVSGAQLWVMQELFESPGIRVGDISEKLSIHQTTTSNLIDALHKRNLIKKERSDEDQRIVKLALTAKGTALLKSAPHPARGLLPEALSRMESKGLKRLNSGLRELIGAIDAGDETHGLQPLPFTM